METIVINATEYRNVSLTLLSESKTNPRRIFEDAALKELAESIRTQGVLSPLLVRPLTENGFEIVAGARRYPKPQASPLQSPSKGRQPHCEARPCSTRQDSS
jgi:ParB family transcriptional regulator, chromosome partitioning protein